MDIMLKRILSLIPKKEDGCYKHGEKKRFAERIGYSGGEIVSMWEKGDSKSYRQKIHQIATVYGVSVEWLKGETDIKTPISQNGDGLSGTNYDLLTPEHQKIVDSLIEQLLASQSPE